MNIREELLAVQRALLDTAKEEHRELTDTEQAQFDVCARMLEKAAADAPAENAPADAAARSLDNPPQDAPDTPAESERSQFETRVREIEGIMDLCEGTGLDAVSFIRSGKTLDEVRAEVLKNEERQQAPLPAGSGVQFDEADRFRACAVDAICMRSGVALEKPADGARAMMGMSLKDIAVRCLANEGVDSLGHLQSRSALDIFETAVRSMGAGPRSRAFMQPTGQFPVFLDQSIEKILVEWYKHPDYQFEKICTIGTLSDFKPHDDNYMSGPVGDFEELPEGGEMKEDTFEFVRLGQRRLKAYAKRFSLSYQAFVNDDIGLIAQMPQKFARAWRRTLNNLVFGILVGNAVMGDGAKMFSQVHKNLLSEGTTVNTASITSMRYALRSQTDQFGESIVIQPQSLIVPVGLDYDIATLFMSPTIETADNTKAVNPLYNLGLEIIEDESINILAEAAGLETVPWFMCGSSQDAPGIEVDYLNGQSQLQRRMGQPMDQLGFVWNFWGFAGVTAMDYRRYVENPGTKIEPQIPVV